MVVNTSVPNEAASFTGRSSHEDAFNLLARMNQTGEPVTPIPGNKGNDCLAFVLNARGRIAMALVCEAKCTTGHASSYVRQAHTQWKAPEAA